MDNIKKGDIVGRKSYNKDILFSVKKIIKTNNSTIAILSGIIERIEADSDISDLEKIEKEQVKNYMSKLDNKLKNKIQGNRQYIDDKEYKIAILSHDNKKKEKIMTGKILHLDGDCIFVYTLQTSLNTGL